MQSCGPSLQFTRLCSCHDNPVSPSCAIYLKLLFMKQLLDTSRVEELRKSLCCCSHFYFVSRGPFSPDTDTHNLAASTLWSCTFKLRFRAESSIHIDVLSRLVLFKVLLPSGTQTWEPRAAGVL